VPFWGAIPLAQTHRQGGDKGRPIVLEKPNSVAVCMITWQSPRELLAGLQGTSQPRGRSRSRDLGNREQGRASLVEECHPTIGLENGRRLASACANSHAVVLWGGRPSGNEFDAGTPIGVPIAAGLR